MEIAAAAAPDGVCLSALLLLLFLFAVSCYKSHEPLSDLIFASSLAVLSCPAAAALATSN